MNEFEYTMKTFQSEETLENYILKLNEMGKQGWMLVHRFGHEHIFMRQVIDESIREANKDIISYFFGSDNIAEKYKKV